MKKPVEKIRFGVVCDSTHLQAWQELVIKKLISEADIELELVVFEGRQSLKAPLVTSLQDASISQRVLWRLYYKHRIEKKSKALIKVRPEALFEAVLKLHCDFIVGKDGRATLKDSDIKKIENEALDFILDFSSRTLNGKVCNVARYGIWCFRFGELTKFSGNPPCFWEIYHENLVTSAHLIRLTMDAGSIASLAEGYLKTVVVYSKNIDNIHFESTAWPLKVCQDIRTHRTKDLNMFSNVQLAREIPPPTNLQLLRFFSIQFKLLVKRTWKSLFYADYWNIGLSYTPIHEFLDSEKTPVVNWFPNVSKARFMADPFGICYKDNLYILYEDLLFEQGIGKTGSFLFKNGAFTENEIVMDETFHISYPFLFEHGGQIYCIPETCQANQVRLYKAEAFPAKWKMEKVLIANYPGLDNTLLEHEGGWFLFSTNKNSGPHYHLNIHYADSLFGAWHPHPKNPVKTDIRSVRPAGSVFEHNGTLFRPSMDYSEKIEGRISINKIVTLNRVEFKEEMHTIVDPFKNSYFSDKVHTLNKMGAYTLVDGAKELFIFSSFNVFRYKLKRGLARLKKKSVS